MAEVPAGVASRTAAYRALRRVHGDGAWSTRAVDGALRASDLDARDRAFAASLAYETLRWEGTLDWALGHALRRPLSSIQPELVDVLRLGAWQLLYGGVPDRAAVATAVDLARDQVGAQATGFTNGVLRGLARERDRLPWPPEDTAGGLALTLGYPEWVVHEATARFGEHARAVLAAGNDAPGLTLRAVGERAALIAELRDGGIEAEPGRYAPETVRAPGADPAALPAVREGRAAPQDEASTIVGHVVLNGSDAGDVVYDAAAAPGGKATHLAHHGRRVVAGDLHPRRALLVGEAAARSGVGGRVSVLVADAAAPPFRAGAFDAVLLDAPCSGLGVTRRRPELRWSRSADDLARLGVLQLALLEAAAERVRRGGWLVYSVCTWPRAETVEVVANFLAVAGDRFQPGDVQPAALGAGTMLPGDAGVQLDPARDGTDAMYIAAFRRLA